MTEQNDAAQLAEIVNGLSLEFDKLCQERHDEGEEKYGPITWMGNDVVRMMLEELADTVNYCRYQAIKLMMMQEALEAELGEKFEDQQEITLGIQAFKGTKDVGWTKK